MKIIKYVICTQANHGTEKQPRFVNTFSKVEIECPTEEILKENLEIAKKEAYNGEYTVEEVGDE